MADRAKTIGYGAAGALVAGALGLVVYLVSEAALPDQRPSIPRSTISVEPVSPSEDPTPSPTRSASRAPTVSPSESEDEDDDDGRQRRRRRGSDDGGSDDGGSDDSGSDSSGSGSGDD